MQSYNLLSPFRCSFLFFSFFLLLCIHSILWNPPSSFTTALPSPTSSSFNETLFEQWIIQQQSKSLTYLLQNISPNGASPGCIVASTSKSDPPYFYYWVRDGAIVMRALLPFYESDPDQFEPIMWDFLKFNRALQWTPNRSRSPEDPLGLGEPKFLPDGSAFDQEWGRPQYDGPALRAIFAMEFASLYLKKGGKKEAVAQWIYRPEWSPTTLTKLDLEFISKAYTLPCFDLWEEIYGFHFYTLRVHYLALKSGSQFALSMNDTGASEWYQLHSHQVATFLNTSFYQETLVLPTLLDAHRRGFDKPSNLDASILLAALHTFNVEEYITHTFIATLHQFETAFKHFPINQRPPPASSSSSSFPFFCLNTRNTTPSTPSPFPHQAFLSAAVGRYPEDVYMGGQAWYLTTLALSEVYYKLSFGFLFTSHFEVTPMTAPFFKPYPVGRHPTTWSLILNLKWVGDMYLQRVYYHTPPSGEFSEQFHKETGCPCSADNLTWSYAAFLTAVHARKELVQALMNNSTHFKNDPMKGLDDSNDVATFSSSSKFNKPFTPELILQQA